MGKVIILVTMVVGGALIKSFLVSTPEFTIFKADKERLSRLCMARSDCLCLIQFARAWPW